MKNKTLKYSDLSKKQLQYLKEQYIQNKVESMSHQDLKEFVHEIISHQINDTIGKEEEMEAWIEMSSFYGDKFDIIIKQIKERFHPEDRIMTWFDFFNHDSERVCRNMSSFMKLVAPHFTK